MGQLRQRTGAAHINQFFAFRMGKALVNDVLRALHIHFHHQLPAFVAQSHHAGAVENDGLHPRLHLKEPFQRSHITQVTLVLLDLFGDVLCGLIPRQHQRATLQPTGNDLAADLSAQITSCARYQIKRFHKASSIF